MAQKKNHEVDGWLRRPDSAMAIVLLYGPDRGLVSERALAFAQKTGLPLDDPFSVIRLDAADDSQEGRLLDEARTIPMFADKRLIWIKGAANQAGLTGDVTALSANPERNAIILIEAGDLKKTSALRKTVEGAANAMALPCYSDDGRGIDALIDESLSKAGLRINMDARRLLKGNLGGDRLASRGEIEKLMLYCAGRGEITAEDVLNLIGDVSNTATDDLIDAVFSGRLADFDQLFARYVGSGNPPFLVLSAAMRHSHMLQILRDQVEQQGKSVAAAIAGARPPIFFSRKAQVEAALERWQASRLAAAADRLQQAVLRTRMQAALAVPITRQTLYALAIEARRTRQRA